VAKVIEFKKKVCAGDDKKSFVIINQKGNDAFSYIFLVRNEVKGISQVNLDFRIETNVFDTFV
jgi:hypothetical protein